MKHGPTKTIKQENTMKLICPKTEEMPVEIYEPQAVFEACIAQGYEWVKSMMYMHSDDATTHYFKDSITRKYKVAKLK